jgi:excisionase family DNA binding protein
MVVIEESTLEELVKRAMSSVIESALKKMQEPEYVTTAQAAKLLCLSPRTLHNWRGQRLLPFHKVGGRVVFRLDELRQFNSLHFGHVRKKTAS